MKSIILLLSGLLLSFQVSASMSQSQVLKAASGRYELSMGQDKISFVLRSKGNIMIFKSTFDYLQGELQITGSSNSYGPDGLPILNLVFSEGSDEETRGMHLLLTVEQDWSGEDHEVRPITLFGTFNDGPNDYSTYEGTYKNYKLKKYSKKTKKYELLK
jgi:hypothetical protein